MEMGEMNGSYHQFRLKEDPKRKILWNVLTRYLQEYVPVDSRVLDFGAGYCDFINRIQCSEKFAYDIWEGVEKHAEKQVTTIIGDPESFVMLDEGISDSSIDVVFASNIFEHFTAKELVPLLSLLRTKLDVGGKIIIIQPNFHYAYRRYFDDYTHKSIWTHVSLADFLNVNNFQTTCVKPKFLPLTVKSKLPVHPILIKLYLILPFKPLAGQMMMIAKK